MLARPRHIGRTPCVEEIHAGKPGSTEVAGRDIDVFKRRLLMRKRLTQLLGLILMVLSTTAFVSCLDHKDSTGPTDQEPDDTPGEFRGS